VLIRLIEDECRHLHARYVAAIPGLREVVASARHDVPLRLTARQRPARSVKMGLAARRRRAVGLGASRAARRSPRIENR
jgi:hypothetical protein